MKNKKKVLSSAISLALASVMCVGLAACGEKDEGKTPSEIVQNLVSEKIDEATWNEFFKDDENGAAGLMMNSFNNVKTEVRHVRTFETKEYKVVVDMTATSIYSNYKEYVKTTTEVTITGEAPDDVKEDAEALQKENEYYISFAYDEESGEIEIFQSSIIRQENGKWVRTPYGLIDVFWTGPYSLYGAVDIIAEYAIEMYENYEYSEEDKGYKLAVAYDSDSSIFKFKDNKLKTFYMNTAISDEEEDLSIAFYFVFTYGGQSVTLPKVTE